jgi:hypothetical protein
MCDGAISLEAYLKDPLSVPVEGFASGAEACFRPFFSPFVSWDFDKWRAITASAARLTAEGWLQPFTLNRQNGFRPMAYMRDGDGIYLSRGLLLRRSAITVLSTYCHELSHVKLSQAEDYPAIKALQKEFKARYSQSPLCELASPIEVWAMVVSRRLMTAIAEQVGENRHKAKLSRLLCDLDGKIAYLEGEIRKLTYHDIPSHESSCE